MIIVDKITKLEPHRGYYLKPGHKLITAKPIMQLEVPGIGKKKRFLFDCYGAKSMSNEGARLVSSNNIHLQIVRIMNRGRCETP